MIDIQTLVREHIKTLTPYSSARDEYTGNAMVWMDANENPFKGDYNRYPDPKQGRLKKRIAELKGIDKSQIFIGNGSDEAIDLLFRAFCEPNKDKAYVFTPTYGMYKVSAHINQVELISLDLDDDFNLPSLSEIQKKATSKGLLFICSPNNPTGNTYSLDTIKTIADGFNGIVVVDEAYIDFSDTASVVTHIASTPNLVVLQTLSKAYGLAGLRLGMAFANTRLIDILNTIKPPYNINTYSQEYSLSVLDNMEKTYDEIRLIKAERVRMKQVLETLHNVKHVYPSQANFLLVEFKNANKVYQHLKLEGIIVRNRNSEIKNTLRISIGTKEQNTQLLNALRNKV